MSYLEDDFDRAAGALGVADSGQTWTVLRGTVVINGSNQASAGAAAESIAVLDAGVGGQNAIVGAQWPTADDQAIYFRVTDASNWWRFGTVRTSGNAAGGLALEKSVAGVVTRVWFGGATIFVLDQMRVWALGNRIRVYHNQSGSTAADLSDEFPRADITDSFNASATKHGIGAQGSTGGNTAAVSDAFFINAPNDAPNAPSLVSPVGGAVISRTVTQRLSWAFSDPNPGDTQSAFLLRYRVVGDPTWIVLDDETPNTYLDVASGTFDADDHEWQVSTADALGTFGPYSASGFFTAETPPPGPTITAPTNGSTLGAATVELTWSSATQDAYEVRSLADDVDGNPDTGTVLYSSGTVDDPALRAHTVPLPVTDRYEHLQVRTIDAGLPSPWSSVRVLVSYTPPATPVVTLDPDDATASITVLIDNPMPTGGQPAVVEHHVSRLDLSTSTSIRIAVGQVPGEPYVDRSVAHLVEYAYQVTSVGSNGTTVTSEWIGAPTPTPDPDPDIVDGGTPADSGDGDPLDGGGP